jgi:gamma-glutamyl:cysteine ligase YbdK (ATP-grasp superfamily)
MGQEITGQLFSDRDFAIFHRRLTQETQLLATWFEQLRFADQDYVAGFELEAWLVDAEFQPACLNAAILQDLQDPLVTPELACFNIELNVAPQALHANALSKAQQDLQILWRRIRAAAQTKKAELVMIGILPTVKDSDLVMANISNMNRYHALNEQVFQQRQGRPISLRIHGNEVLRVTHQDVMLESATTSFQIHLQVPLQQAARAYNASVIVSAPMVAVSANSPYLFGKDLWHETRIPLFEQAVEVGGYGDGRHGPLRRVSFGSGYVQKSLLECFQENLEHYPALLPTIINDAPEKFSNVRLHNGTLWRWNRPLIGVENDKLHLRIEHRVVPAGPSVLDSIANAAFYYGLTHRLCQCEIQPEIQLPFNQARDNFYQLARYGMEGQMVWLDGKKYPVRTLLAQQLIPMARRGLEELHIDSADIDKFIGVIEQRVANNCNGAAWQRAFVAKHGPDMQVLTKAYVERQNSGQPVHEWAG